MIESEASFQTAVIGLAQALGWRVAHFRTSLNQRGAFQTAVAGDGKGFPDLVLVRDRVIFAELKTDIGSMAPDQKLWGAALQAAGVEWHLWRPRQWREIEATLAKRVPLVVSSARPTTDREGGTTD